MKSWLCQISLSIGATSIEKRSVQYLYGLNTGRWSVYRFSPIWPTRTSIATNRQEFRPIQSLECALSRYFLQRQRVKENYKSKNCTRIAFRTRLDAICIFSIRSWHLSSTRIRCFYISDPGSLAPTLFFYS